MDLPNVGRHRFVFRALSGASASQTAVVTAERLLRATRLAPSTTPAGRARGRKVCLHVVPDDEAATRLARRRAGEAAAEAAARAWGPGTEAVAHERVWDGLAAVLDEAPPRGPIALDLPDPGRRVRAWLSFRAAWAERGRGGVPTLRDTWLRGAWQLASQDPRCEAVLLRSPLPRRPRVAAPFPTLARAIVWQQLSGRAAATIWGRVLAALGPTGLSPAALLDAPVERLRAAGLSAAKAAALADLARKSQEGLLEARDLARASDEEVVRRIVAVRGLGVWSAEMHLIFGLARPDVWPGSDLGVRKGLARILGRSELPDVREMPALGEAFRPWRSVAATLCWFALELPEAGEE